MRLSSLRLTLLGWIARLLRRWLGVVTAQLESASPPDRAAPTPPDHWVELVRQSAPQLLESQSDAPGVIDYRADDPLQPAARPDDPLQPGAYAEMPQIAIPMPRSRHPNATPAARRPLRLVRVSARSLAAPQVEPGEAGSRAEPTRLPTLTPALNPPKPMPRRAPSLPDDQAAPRPQPADATGETPLTPHYAEFPFERTRVREISASLPGGGSVPHVRTRADGGAQARPARPAVPESPPQIVLRPTIVPSSPELADVRPDRWPSLPDPPAEERRDPSVERQRRERLIREQEGQAWSE